MTLGLSSIEEATAFSRVSASDQGCSQNSSHEDGLMAGQVILDAKVAVSRSALSVSLQLIDMFRNTLLQIATNCDG